jgi:hypothetical protein
MAKQPNNDSEPKRNPSGIEDRESGPSDPSFNDVKKNWLRGFGSPHPHFDGGREGREKK